LEKKRGREGDVKTRLERLEKIGPYKGNLIAKKKLKGEKLKAGGKSPANTGGGGRKIGIMTEVGPQRREAEKGGATQKKKGHREGKGLTSFHW